MQCLYLIYLEEFKKMLVQPIVVQNNFPEGFGHYTDQNRSFKGENK